MNEMNARTEGFCQNRATLNNFALRNEAREAFKTSLAEFRQRLQHRRAEIDGEYDESLREYDESVNEIDSTQVASVRLTKYSRRILLPTDQPLDVEEIQLVNRLYHAEGEALDRAQRAIFTAMSQQRNEGTFPATFTGKELREHFQTVYDTMRRTTDRVAKLNDLTASSGTTEPVGNVAHQDDEMLLEEFFQICPMPNLAEMLMLSTLCGNRPVDIWSWFESKRKENWKFFHAMLNFKNKQRAGNALGKHQQGHGSR